MKIERSELSGCVASRFRRVAAHYADETALRWSGRSFTYRDLDAASDALAHDIAERLGDGEEPVPFRLEAGPLVCVAILGLLKAGKAYVALDPLAPLEFHREIVRKLGARLILSVQGAMTPPDLPRLDLDIPGSGGFEPRSFEGARLASVVFTSGSSGRPKGVERTHTCLLHRAYLCQIDQGIRPDDRQGLLNGAHFVASETPLFGALLTGAALCPYPRQRPDPEHLADWLELEGVTGVGVPVGLFRLFATQLAAGRRLARLRLISLGGEPVLRSDVTLWREKLAPGCRLIHRYSSSEVGNISLLEVDEDVPFFDDRLPAGRACRDKTVRIEEPDGREVPIGAAGEIVVYSPFVSRGYWGQPELTARTFANGGCRTGDLGRLTHDGLLQHLGRADAQLKVRGHRVDPGQVEAALLEHLDVDQAAVVCRDGETLVAFVVTSQGGTPQALRAHLAERLPPALIPNRIEKLDVLPLTSTGKPDRQALSARPLAVAASAGGAFDRLEGSVADAFEAAIGIRPSSSEQSFFEIGGHSLQALSMVWRLRESLGIRLGVADVFENSSPARLARVIEARRATRATAGETGPVRVARDGPLPLLPAQQGLWFQARLDPDSPAANLAIVLRMTGPLDEAALRRALDALRVRHEALRTRFPSIDGAPVQWIDTATPWPMSIRAAASKADLEQQLQAVAQAPFDLRDQAPCRATLWRGPGEALTLLLCLHHIITDGQSNATLAADVCSLYTAECGDESSRLPDLPLQPADYAAWLASRSDDGEVARWSAGLAGVPPLRMPVSGRRLPAGVRTDTAAHSSLGPELSEAVRTLSADIGVTPFTTLLAGFEFLIWRATGQADFAIGVPMSRRPFPELRGLVGCFVNTVALRAEVSREASFRGLVESVRARCLEAHAHGDVSLSRVIQAVSPARQPGRHPLFQVMFGMREPRLEERRLGDLHIRHEGLDGLGATAFELSLFVRGEGPPYDIELETSVFNAEAVRWWLDGYTAALSVACRAADLPLSALPER